MEAPRGTDDLMTSLKVISSIRAHEKFQTSGPVVNVENNQKFLSGLIPEFMRRWWNGESREKNIQQITTVIDTAFQHLKTSTQNNTDKIFAMRLRTELKNTSEGLRNLIATYETDPVTTARIHLLIDRITITLQQEVDSQRPNNKQHRDNRKKE